MQKGLRLGRIVITPGFLLLAALVCVFEPEPLVVYFLASALLHELGHLVALYAAGGRAAQLTLSASGAVMECGMERLSYPRELAVYTAGIGVNLAIAAVSALFARTFSSQTLYIFAGANAALAIFNLLPANALDGGRTVKTLCMMIFDRETILPRILNVIVVAALIGLCGRMALQGSVNIALLWMAGWLLLGSA